MRITTDGERLLSEAKWIWPEMRIFDLYNTYAHFRKDFSLASVPQKTLFYITADQSYRLFINGKHVTRGPARGYQAHWPYDEIEVSSWLNTGYNYICVEVYNAGIGTLSYVSHTAAGLICAGDFGSVKIRSDASWISRFDCAHKRDTARYSVPLNFQEHVDSRKDDRKWIKSQKAPKGWKTPEEAVYGSMPWHELEERGIPQLQETLRLPVKLISSGEGRAIPGYRNWRNIVSGLCKEWEKSTWRPENIELGATDFINVPYAGEERYQAVVLDLGETVVGPSVLSVEGGKPGLVIDIFYHERLETTLGPFALNPDLAGFRQAIANRLILSGNKVTYDFYQMIGFRYATIIVRENKTPISVKFEVLDTGYPYTLTGWFECSDKALNDIWKICRRTEQVCSLDAYVDTPWREQVQWWGDARIQFWNTMAIDGDIRLFKRGIRSMAGQKVPNGLTYGNAPSIAHNCILPDFSLI